MYKNHRRWSIANASCLYYTPEGTGGGQWRLPAYDELTGWANNLDTLTLNKGETGLQLCDRDSSSYGVVRCAAPGNGCVGTGGSGNVCRPDMVWGDAANTSMSNFYSYTLNNAKFVSNGTAATKIFAFSARCVLDGISDTISASDTTIEIDSTLDSQEDCDKLGTGLLFITKETTGSKNMCVMKYNIGDTGVENRTGVQICQTGDTCTVENDAPESPAADNPTPTCWKGTTAASGCSSNYGGYSGCTRTVCNWTGADKLCENYKLGINGWRLPTFDELTAFTNDTYSNSTLASQGLMFCDYNSDSAVSPVCQYLSAACTGAYNNGCGPSGLWSSTFSSSDGVSVRGLSSLWHDDNAMPGSSLSARCVLDEDAYKNAFADYVIIRTQ